MFSEAGLKIWLGKVDSDRFDLKDTYKTKEGIDVKGKTTISIHQEKLIDSNQREEMKNYWDKVIETLTKEITTTR